MITTCELTDTIERMSQSKEALTEFARRLARALEEALSRRDVIFHAINDGSAHYAGDGFDHVVKVTLTSKAGAWDCRVSEGMGHDPLDGAAEIANITTLSDSEITHICDQWAEKIAAISKRIVFQNLYCPRATEFAEPFNDLKVAFRIVRAWDAVRCLYILRFDANFKNLAA